MKASFKILALGLTLLAGPAYAQVPAVISAPISEKISRKQIVHQGVSTTLMGQGKVLANDMKVVSGKIKGIIDKTQQLHDEWYSSLLQVSAGVRNYRRVREIYTHQSEMISQFSTAIPELRNQQLSPVQLNEATTIYQGLLTENIALLGELAGVMSAGRSKMTDPEQHILMNYFTNNCRAVAQMQAQQVHDREFMTALMGGR
jgi:hypothetical protein